MKTSDLTTPTLILDKSRLARNIAAMTARVRELGVDLRPHLKTAKSADIARLALQENKGGITVATLREAEYFLDNAITDITLAVPICPTKLDHAVALMDRGADLKLITDNAGVANTLAQHSGPMDGSLKVLVEIDCGEHRTGVEPNDPELLEIANILNDADGIELEGVLTHAGHSYSCRSQQEFEAVAEEERLGAVQAAEILRVAGLPCATVSTGSTPCVMYSRDMTGVTEVRPGVYMLGDMFHVGLGTRTVDEVALTVLASVIAHRPNENELYIDAGGLALSKDRATAAFDDDRDVGFGLVCDAETGAPLEGLHVASVHQEHGQVVSKGPMPFDRLPVGAKVRVIPNHVCMTVAAYDFYNVIDGDGDSAQVIATWGRCNGW